MPWILILLLVTPQGLKLATIEVSSKAACLDAAYVAQHGTGWNEKLTFSCSFKRTS